MWQLVLRSRQRVGLRQHHLPRRRGNGSTAPTSRFKFDDTLDDRGGAAARAPDKNGWYNHAVVVNFTATDNLSGGVRARR